jgi:hypothetical protein
VRWRKKTSTAQFMQTIDVTSWEDFTICLSYGPALSPDDEIYELCPTLSPDDQIPAWYFAHHEEVFAENSPDKSLLWKFNIPATERLKVLKILDGYNLNALSLFESDETLMETMALRHYDFKRF